MPGPEPLRLEHIFDLDPEYLPDGFRLWANHNDRG